MLKRLYAVYDVKTGTYGTVMVLLTDGEALRVAEDEANRSGSMLNSHSADFRLDYLGEFNPFTGEINTADAPRHVIDIAQLKKVGAEKAEATR